MAPRNPDRQIDPEKEFPLDLALKFYGLGTQADIGDNTAKKPPVYDLRSLYLWEAYEANKGMSVKQARIEFLKLAYRELAKRNLPIKENKEEEVKVAEYKQCLLDEGLSFEK